MKLNSNLMKTMIISTMIISTSISTFASTGIEKPSLTLSQAINRAITSCDKKTVYSRYAEAYEEINKYNKDLFSQSYRSSKLKQETYDYYMKYINAKVAYDTTDTYLSVISLNKQIEMCNNNLDIAEKELNQVAIKKSKGMASELEYKEAQNQVNTAKTTKTKLEKALENEKNEFHNLTNMVITNYELEDEFTLEPLSNENITSYYFDKKLEEYYGLKEEQISIGQIGLKVLDDSTLGDYMLKEANLVSDQYTLDDLKETMGTTLMSYYNNLDGYKADVETYDIKLKSARNKLNAQEIKYNNGFISKLEYEKALLTVQQLEDERFDKIKTYLVTKMIIEEPNILAMSN